MNCEGRVLDFFKATPVGHKGGRFVFLILAILIELCDGKSGQRHRRGLWL